MLEPASSPAATAAARTSAATSSLYSTSNRRRRWDIKRSDSHANSQQTVSSKHCNVAAGQVRAICVSVDYIATLQ